MKELNKPDNVQDTLSGNFFKNFLNTVGWCMDFLKSDGMVYFK